MNLSEYAINFQSNVESRSVENINEIINDFKQIES